MPWQARLDLDYTLQQGRTVLQHAHSGPLRVLKSLYPEGDAICHNVLVHPPAGLVGGDTLDIAVTVQPGAHALLSTPGATRFYRSEVGLAAQRVRLDLQPGARLEWVPLETLAYPGCDALNQVEMALRGDAELIGWDVCALGLPAAGQAFDHGCIAQKLSVHGLWLEQSLIDAADTRLLNSPVGLDGQRCLGSLWLASGQPLGRERIERLLEAARAVLPDSGAVRVAATSPNPNMVVVRATAALVEPLMAVFQAVWAPWRAAAWGLATEAPRIWRI